MRTPRTLRLGLVLAAIWLAMTACSTVVDGSGRAGVTGAPDGGQVNPPTTCPDVRYPGAHLRFSCITTGLSANYSGPVWPVREIKTVEEATGWVLEEGAGHWGSADGQSLAAIATGIRHKMIEVGGYGEKPVVRTVAARRTTVDGKPAFLLQTTVHLNPSWAHSAGTKVREERLWIVAIETAPEDVSLWYASIPNLARQLWSKVPAIIASIQVG
jgi:hypothetical protein